MAIVMYPGEFPDRSLHSFINDTSLNEYSLKAEYLLTQLPMVFVPRVQFKRPGFKNTCWYVALREEPDVWLVNFTIVPGNLNIEFRLAKYFSVKEEHTQQLGMWYQNNWPTFGLKKIGSDVAISLLTEYITRATPGVLAGNHKAPSRSSAEYFMNQDLKNIFPNHRVRHGERPIRHTNGAFLELDLQIPDLKLAIEVQGPTHYSDLYGNYEEVKSRDEFKKQWCLNSGIKLLHIEWEGYMQTLYRLPERDRQERFGVLVKGFLASPELFREAKEQDLRN